MTTTPTGGSLVLRTPAKLNLGLRLMGLREDGYHLLESVFAPIELWDELEIELLAGSHQIELEVASAAGDTLPAALGAVSAGRDNLAFRAAEAFCRALAIEARIRIRLVKIIPAAAGLGGGSSDAAAVLNGLSTLVGEPVDAATLEGLARGLGADVPFFLDPRASYVTGIGEIIAPLDELPSCELVVANPGISLATAEVYRATDALGSALTEPRPGSTMRAFSRLCRGNGDPGEESAHSNPMGPRAHDLWGDLLVNDLEPAARRLCPPVGRLLGAMREAGAIAASMTGSGATVFGVFESSEVAREAADWLRGSLARAADQSWIRVSRLIGER
ncbi:MAG: 4-(cytidine 5'-diphospho)-2-C-methyl-D-erythritol kinase [Deltaproteobacteria bacterium]|nr:4-(cytidine 5'-diphospho)-2-C-methyl-D-erythritol kinase [Deltaproteobacteria bacterium]